MLSFLVNTLTSGFNALKAGIPIGIKAMKYFVDSTFRDKVTPVPGSVLYCDLWVAVEHSGVYIGEGEIADIVVEGFAEAVVNRSSASCFTSKSTLGRKIYVSCNKHGAVGHKAVGQYAERQIGQRSFYGLVIKNCHDFSRRCVNRVADVQVEASFLERMFDHDFDVTWEPTVKALKAAARDKLGATKWRLWDWQDSDEDDDDAPEPDWQAQQEHFQQLPLTPDNIAQIRQELADTQAYVDEIADETIPDSIRQKLLGFQQSLGDITQKYDEVKDFLAQCPGAGFSYAALQACGEDFAALAQQLANNAQIKDLARKMGRDYISEEKKKACQIPRASKSEVHGTQRSDDVMRLLPSELVNLDDDTLETLFYARLLEKNLQCYELRGTEWAQGEESESVKKRTGPVVACLDTSGSMNGTPLHKAKALLLAIANILQQEDRSLHVLLFGASGEIREFVMDKRNDSIGLLQFLRQGFGGGTDFQTPLQRSLSLIAQQGDYKKADILMLSDGDCQLSPEFSQHLKQQKQQLDCMIYSVLCAGTRVSDTFSDEVVVL